MGEKIKALEAARLQIEKQFGMGSLMKLGANEHAPGIDSVPTGSILLDEALGVGGYPRGRVIEIYGPESSGKTTLALHAIAEAQKKGGIAAFIDAEHALDPVYARNLGVNTDELWVSQPDNGEQALDITESLIRSGAVDIIVIDSVAALTPQAEIEGDMGDAHVGLQARLMSQALRKLTGTLSKSKTILVFINQIRMKIGVMFGNPETTTGGNALKFYSSVRLEVRKVETIEKGEEEAVGNKVRVKVVKNKVAPPFRKVELEIMFGKGISWAGSLIDAAVKYNIVDKKGAWYTWGEEKVGQGRDNAKLYLETNAQAAAEIERQVRSLIFSAQHPESAQAPDGGGRGSPATSQSEQPSPKPATAVVAEKPAGRGPGRPPKQPSAPEPAPVQARPAAAGAKSPPADDDGLF
ncbi:MAG TPA: recombinase RecA [Rectinemataceae bacterium]|nr:recombinase RecA [Rectinemataceae bacterium]